MAIRLERLGKPVITPYDLFLEVLNFYQLEPTNPTVKRSGSVMQAYARIRRNLADGKVIVPDDDYSSRAHRVQKISDRSADEVCCLVDPFCYISHMSAMERYGLSNRRPKALQLSRPSSKLLRKFIEDKTQLEIRSRLPEGERAVPIRIIGHPTIVREREVTLFQTAKIGMWLQIRDSFARIASIGQTFVDTLDQPALCGGMTHVLDIWRAHARVYLEEIIAAIEVQDHPILKVRAGYILDEEMNIKDARVEKWQVLSQRGGSRVLDPTKPYASSFSEKWMISINV